MRVFVAGGTGVVGRRLVQQLVARGHQVTATTTRADKLGFIEQLGATAVVMDGLNATSVAEAVAKARPEVIVNEMTAIAGTPDMKHMDRWFATTNRLRTEGTDHLLAASRKTGASNFIAQSYAAWNGIRAGGWVKTEDDPLDLFEGTSAQPVMEAIQYLEREVVKARGAVLRYGWLYGPGASDSMLVAVRKRQFPLVGGGEGHCSWLHVDDAASAAVEGLGFTLPSSSGARSARHDTPHAARRSGTVGRNCTSSPAHSSRAARRRRSSSSRRTPHDARTRSPDFLAMPDRAPPSPWANPALWPSSARVESGCPELPRRRS
jgi:NAD dependent epimerase/dehydratase family enzyme